MDNSLIFKNWILLLNILLVITIMFGIGGVISAPAGGFYILLLIVFPLSIIVFLLFVFLRLFVIFKKNPSKLKRLAALFVAFSLVFYIAFSILRISGYFLLIPSFINNSSYLSSLLSYTGVFITEEQKKLREIRHLDQIKEKAIQTQKKNAELLRMKEEYRSKEVSENVITAKDEALFPTYDHQKYKLFRRGYRSFLIPNGYDIGSYIIPLATETGFRFQWYRNGRPCLSGNLREQICDSMSSKVSVFIEEPRADHDFTKTSFEVFCYRANENLLAKQSINWHGFAITISLPFDSSPSDTDAKAICYDVMKVIDQIDEINGFKDPSP